jgi:hypothetical protein
MMPRIKRVEFGNIGIDDNVYGKEDFFLFMNGAEATEKTHSPTVNDMEKMLLKEPEIVIFGLGFNSVSTIGEDIKSLAEKNKVKLLLLPTPEALKKFQELVRNGKKVAARIHTTC